MKIADIENKILAEKSDEVRGKCHFCGKEVDGMSWCFGCHKFICDECDKGASGPRHKVEEHKIGTLWD